MNEKPWGYHLILDCYDADKEQISSKSNVEEFSRTLVKTIDMVPFGEPQVVLFGSGDAEGYTLVQLIETSNISAHFSPSKGAFYLDVFSCKEFDEVKVLEVVKEYFSPKKIRERFLERE